MSPAELPPLPDSEGRGARAIIAAGWDDVPHLSEAEKQRLLASYAPHTRDARSKGVPSLGSGAIYPIPESEIVCAPFELPPYYARVYGMDVGWNRTAVVWGAHDRDSDVIYLYSEHYRGQAEPSVHAAAVKARGEWIPGVIDPASRGRGQKDGSVLLNDYRDLGLDLHRADNAVEAGIFAVFERLSTGRLKVFSTLVNWLTEYRLYRRDEKGRVIKPDQPHQPGDHLMDASRYLVVSGLEVATVQLQKESTWGAGSGGAGGWMGA